MKERKGIVVEPIRNGTVIDHIEAGKATKLFRLLTVPPDATMGIVVNVPSRRHGRKDVVFVEGLELTSREIAKIALVTRATLNIVRDGQLVTKQPITVPEVVEGIIRCPVPACVTNHEEVKTRFVMSEGGAACFYCESALPPEEIEANLAS